MPELAPLLAPQSIAVIGASNDTSILRGRTLKVMLGHEYAGRIYPVSRSQTEVQGLKAYPSIDAIPERVDLALLIIPAEWVCDELERCGKAGARAALIVTSGFAEQAGHAGATLQERLREIARRYDMIVCGPNTEGFVNTKAALCATFSPVVDGLNVPLLPQGHASGRVAVVGQSGGIGFAYFDRGRPKNIPFSYIVTTGNEVCLEVFDVVDYLLDEGHTDVFLLFLENIKNADTFKRVADKALRAGKPIVVTKIGHSDAGQRAAASHTAALAGSYDAYRAMFKHYGIVEAPDIEAMIDFAAAFSYYGHKLPEGRRVGIGTASGGGGGWMADACVAAGLTVPTLDEATRAQIDAHLPPYGTSQNPVDGTAQAIREIGYGELARLIAVSDRIDAVIMVTSARNAELFERDRTKLTALAREQRKPVFMWTYTLPSPDSVRTLSDCGYPLFTDMNTCARAVAVLCGYRERRARYLQRPAYPPLDRIRSRRLSAALLAGPLCEYQVAPVLRDYGICSIDAILTHSAEEAIASLKQLDTPIAMKVQSRDIPHKTEAHAVALNLADAGAVRDAYEQVLRNAHAFAPHAAIDGVLVQRMAPSGLEVIVAIRRDAQFGPMLLLGLGGVHVEVLRDFVLAPAPLTDSDAQDMIERLQGRALFAGVRGRRPADSDALIDLLVKLSQLAVEAGDALGELELNPVLVHEQGHGISIVDALMTLPNTAR